MSPWLAIEVIDEILRSGFRKSVIMIGNVPIRPIFSTKEIIRTCRTQVKEVSKSLH